jgi:hypothetical protein
VSAPYVPDIGETFTVSRVYNYRRWQWNPFPWYARRSAVDSHSYRVTSWMRQRDITPPEHQTEEEAFIWQVLDELLAEEGPRRRGFGPDNVPMEYCHREEAEYVHGYGVAGIIIRCCDVAVDGRVDWDEKHIQKCRDQANQLAGEPLR